MSNKEYARYNDRIQKMASREEAAALAEELVMNTDPEARDLCAMLHMVRSARWPEDTAGG